MNAFARALALVATVALGASCLQGGPPVAAPEPSTSRTQAMESVSWEPADIVEVRQGHGLVAFGGKVVLFGGRSGVGPLDDLWEWDGTSWARREVTPRPPARSGHAMAVLGQKLVLFGGSGAAGPLGDTWEWDGVSWTQRSVASPPARSRHVLAPAAGKLVLFGGEGAGGVDLADTWEWDGATWTQRQPAQSPPARSGHAAAARGTRAVIFGGLASNYFSDTWEWDGTTWTSAGSGGQKPSGRRDHAMATLGTKVVLFGGYGAGQAAEETWEWDGAAWTKRSPGTVPPGRSGHALATLGGSVVLFGGAATARMNDTWTWNGTTWTLHPTPQGPQERYAHAGATHNGKLVVFGGGGSGAISLSDTWEWSGSAWTRLLPAQSPSARTHHAMAPLGGVVVLFGGVANGTPLADTWEWNGSTWTRRMPATSPPARSRHALATHGNKVVLFGGYDGTTPLADTWEWDGTNWTQRTPATAPSPRFSHAMAPAAGRVVLFGGTVGGLTPALGQTWEWDGSAWTQRSPAQSPPARERHALSARGAKAVLFGGTGAGGRRNDTWEWDGTAWTQTLPALLPPVRTEAAFAEAGGDVVLFGGWGPNNSSGMVGDTWTYRVQTSTADRLVFLTQPSNITAGAPFVPDVQVRVEDPAGNPVPSTAQVTLGFAVNAGGGALVGTATAPSSNGIATFAGLTVDKPGTGYALTATAPGLLPASSATFDVAGTGTSGGEPGTPCGSSADCESGWCAHGVCCRSDCSGPCVSCNLGASAGTCLPVPDGTSCGNGVACDGEETCEAGMCAPGVEVACVDPAGEEPLVCVEPAGACVPAPDVPPTIREDALAAAGLGLWWPYNAAGRVVAYGSRPMTFGACGGPAGFAVDASTGGVTWRPDVAGTFSLCVAAQNAAGSDTYNFDVEVAEPTGGPPVARPVLRPDEGPVPLEITADGAGSSADVPWTVASWRWDFGDGSPWRFGVEVPHTVLLPGGHQVELRVQDSLGREGTARAPLRAHDETGRRPPLARIVAGVTSGTDSLEVAFACDCSEGDAPVVAWLWDFGSGESTQAAPVHTFTPGRWRVHLTVVDAHGLPARDHLEVVVTRGGEEPPHCRAFVDPPAGPAPLRVTFQAPVGRGDAELVRTRFTFDDGTGVEAAEVPAQLDVPLWRRARLEVTDAAGLTCVDRVEAVALGGVGQSVPPRILSRPPEGGACGERWTYTPTAAGQGPLAWRAEPLEGHPLPARLEVDPDSGEVSLMPGSEEPSVVVFGLRAEGPGGVELQRVELEVRCDAPAVYAVGCGCGVAGSAWGWGWGWLMLAGLAVRRARGHRPS